ncbi:MAG: TetR/AcrR family transcriptional regulator [Bacillota bacterium]|nr:TetR/AcrR family transcriptional regulator [Bacillota bacterium]
MGNKNYSKAEIKADKKQLIMEAAMALFLEKGYANTRIIDIAEKAGIGKGTVYAYFESKEELMVTIIRDIVRKDHLLMAPDLDGVGSLREKLVEYIGHWEKMISKYGLYAVMFKEQIVLNPGVNSDEAMALVEEMSRDQYLRLHTIIKEGMESGEIRKSDIHHAAIFTMTAVGTYMISALSSFGLFEGHNKGFHGSEPVQSFGKEEIVDFILNGIG